MDETRLIQPDAIEYVVIAAYLALLVGIALSFRKLNQNVSDYFRSGCQGTWWLVGTSALMSTFSAYTFTGAAGAAYEAGWSVAIIFIANFVGFMVNALLSARWFRQLRAITTPEIIKERFGPWSQQFYSWVGAINTLLYASLTLYGLSIFSHAIFGFDISQLIIVLGLIALVYSLIGGSWAVMATDFVQATILIPVTVLIAVLSLQAVGGVGGFFEGMKQAGLEKHFSLFNEPQEALGYKYTYLWALAIFLNVVTERNGMRAAPRYFSAKDGREASRAAWLAGIVMLLGAVIWFIPPMVARLLFADQVMATDIAKPDESAYAIIAINLLPSGMIGLMIVGMFAATMSAMDTGINRNAAIFTQDIFPIFKNLLRLGELKEKTYFLIGEIATAVMGLSIIALALRFAATEGKGVFEQMLNVDAILSVPLLIPLVWGMLVRKTPGYSGAVCFFFALVPAIVGATAGADLYRNTPGLDQIGWLTEPWRWQTRMLVTMGIGSVGFLLTLWWWGRRPAPERQRIDGFFDRMTRPVDFAAEVGRANDHLQAMLIGRAVLITAAAMSLLLLIPNGWGLSGRLGILAIVLTTASIGGLLRFAAWRSGPDPVALPATGAPPHHDEDVPPSPA